MRSERAEADARFQATRAETEAAIQAARAEADARDQAARARAEAGFERLRLADEQARAQIAADRRKWGEMANKMGTLVEDIVAPSIPEVCRQVFGLEAIESSAQRVHRTHRHDRRRQREFDHVVIAGEIVLVTEAKSTIRPRDIVTFVRVLEEIRAWLWEADGRRAVGALAALLGGPVPRHCSRAPRPARLRPRHRPAPDSEFPRLPSTTVLNDLLSAAPHHAGVTNERPPI